MLLTISDGIDSFAQFMTVLILFLFVLGITYLTTRFIAGYQKGQIKTGNMELIEVLRISNNKYLQIVKAGKKYLVMAVCKDTVTMLAQLEEEELILDQNEGTVALDFKGILESIKNKQFKNKDQETTNEGK